MTNALYPMGPYSFYKNQRITNIWIGDRIFLAERTFQKDWKEGDWQGDLPVPDWDEWLAHSAPVNYAEYRPTETMFTLWFEKEPYKFAVNAVNSYWLADEYVTNEFDLQNWLTRNGVHMGDVMFGRNMLSRFTDLLPISFNLKNYVGWCRWGGVYIPDPTYTE